MAVTYEAHGVIKFTAALDEDPRILFINKIIWDGSTTAGDDLVITDKNDKELWVVNNKETNAQACLSLGGHYVNGLKIATLDAGTVYVYTQ